MLPQIKIKFSLYGDCEKIDLVSDKLQIKDAKIQRKKDFAVPTYAEDSWTLEMGYEDALDISILTDKLYNKLCNITALINKAKTQLSLDSIITIVIQADVNQMPIVALNKKIIKLACETNSEIHFDNYFDDYQ